MSVPGRVRCPVLSCGEYMVKRTNMTNGRLFWSCPRWPECAGTLPMSEAEKLMAGGFVPLPLFEPEGEP